MELRRSGYRMIRMHQVYQIVSTSDQSVYRNLNKFLILTLVGYGQGGVSLPPVAAMLGPPLYRV